MHNINLNFKAMKRINLLGCIILFSIFIFTSCDSNEGVIEFDKSNAKDFSQENPCGEEKVLPLIAGQHINIGTVTISNDETNLYVTYETTGDWVLTETHVYAGPDEDIPYTKKGNPKFGHFPYKEEHNNVQSFTYTISLGTLDDCFSVITHAATEKIVNGQSEQGETAFGCGDKEFPGNRWGCYTDYCVQECEEDGAVDVFGRKVVETFYTCLDVPVNGEVLSGFSSRTRYHSLKEYADTGRHFELYMYVNDEECVLQKVD